MVTFDAIGIGRAVVELARQAAPSELHLVAVTIGAGRALTRHGDNDLVVGKHRLTEVAQVALEQAGLLLPDTPGAYELHRQLGQFNRRRTRSGYQRHEAAGRQHDDLVLALALALWTGDLMHDQQAGVAS
ncbi:hypothetical protein MOQ72_27195 [Saccharopolyspora sp. K220]|uniref:hypothetical protein n=1 Tax=Saccharopolyspora soli TaxID=2926618 RepID=UPI001F56BF9E|nr:hypothetical protein [Saccharopolyspora soli]MCI2421135.1 hypothetical protein [Saccharopolyspora soli]